MAKPVNKGKERTYRTKLKQQDQQILDEFLNFYGEHKQLKKGSLLKHQAALSQLLSLTGAMGVSLPELREEHVVRLMKEVRQSPWSEDTREDYWQRFRIIYKWGHKRNGGWNEEVFKLLHDEDEPMIYRIDENKVQPKGILSPEQVLQLVHAEPNLSYKAFYSVLYESGMRSGEALSLQCGDVKKDKKGGYVIQLRKSKTEKRPIPLINFSVAYLSRWLAMHPHRDDPGTALFTNNLGEPLSNFAANKRLKLLLRGLRIRTPKITLHSFRHSRATELAGMLNEFQMCKFFGWRLGSEMPRVYIRKHTIDVGRALRQGYGLEDQEEKPTLEARKCLHCEHPNPMDAEYCDVCSLPLNEERLHQLKTNADADRMQALLKKMLRENRRSLIDQIKSEILDGSK